MSKNLKNIADRELLKRFQQDNNKEAFGIWYKRYLPLLLGTCKRFLTTQEDAEDLVMELFEKCMHILKEKTDVQHLRPYMYVVAKNAALGKLRSKQVWVEYSEIVERVLDEEKYNEFILNNINDADLDNALGQLAPMQRKCIELFYFKKMRYVAISAELKIDLKEVKSQLQNGKRMLKNQLIKESNYGNE